MTFCSDYYAGCADGWGPFRTRLYFPSSILDVKHCFNRIAIFNPTNGNSFVAEQFNPERVAAVSTG